MGNEGRGFDPLELEDGHFLFHLDTMITRDLRTGGRLYMMHNSLAALEQLIQSAWSSHPIKHLSLLSQMT